ncbi:MAG: hypothetical protein IJ638_03570 [Alphaproteobacteria bacterium]|nr:hypothetical protein [Alphaproteobacteria bacterium]
MVKNKKSNLSYEDEIAWKERQMEIKNERKFESEYEEENVGKKWLVGVDEKVMQRCFQLLDVVKKYLTINNGDFSMYDRFYERFRKLSNHIIDEQNNYGAWKELRDGITLYILDDIGYDNIKIYLPKGTRIPKPKIDFMKLLLNHPELFNRGVASDKDLSNSLSEVKTKDLEKLAKFLGVRTEQFWNELFGIEETHTSTNILGRSLNSILKVIDDELEKRHSDKLVVSKAVQNKISQKD